MKQRGRNRPFWDKGSSRPGERTPREAKGERGGRESPGERAARAFEEIGAGRKPPRKERDTEGADEPRRRSEDEPRRRREEPPRQGRRPLREEARPHGQARSGGDTRSQDFEPRRHQAGRQRDDARPRREVPPAPRRREGPEPVSSQHRRERREDARHARDAGRESPVATDGSLVFGVQPVLEALRAGRRPVERLTVVEGAHEARVYEILALARAADVPVRRAPRAELHRLAEGANHQGVVAHIAAARYTDAVALLDALAARVGANDPPLALVLDGVADPRNLGAIIRTAECAGAHGLFVPERRAVGLTETVAKAAAGALEYVPVARAANLARLVDELKERGVWTVGTAADAEINYTEWDWTQACALVLGGEGEGLRRLVRERCDVLVRIPLRGRISSLNVSVAAGILLYEARRQRTPRGGET